MAENVDYATLYKNDWRAFTDVYDGIWTPNNRNESKVVGVAPNPRFRYPIIGIKYRSEDIARPIYQQLTAGLSINSTTAVLCCWNPTTQPFIPRIGDMFTDVKGVVWGIKSERQSKRSKHYITIDKMPINAI